MFKIYFSYHVSTYKNRSQIWMFTTRKQYLKFGWIFFSRLEKETFKKGISTELFLFWEARVTFKHCNNVLYYVWIPRQFKRFSKRKHCNHQNFGSYFLFTPNADPKKIRAYFKRPNGSPYSCDSFDLSLHFVSELS